MAAVAFKRAVPTADAGNGNANLLSTPRSSIASIVSSVAFAGTGAARTMTITTNKTGSAHVEAQRQRRALDDDDGRGASWGDSADRFTGTVAADSFDGGQGVNTQPSPRDYEGPLPLTNLAPCLTA